MSARHQLGVSRRDVGAGVVAGVAALLANVLFHASMMARIALSDPAGVWSYLEWDPLFLYPLVVTPVVAVLVGTVVWRWLVPEAPTPGRGAVAGVVTAFASMLGVALAFGVPAGLSELSHGTPFGAVSTGLFFTGIVFVLGSFATGAIFAPVGAAVGYGYEWYLSRRRDASLGS